MEFEGVSSCTSPEEDPSFSNRLLPDSFFSSLQMSPLSPLPSSPLSYSTFLQEMSPPLLGSSQGWGGREDSWPASPTAGPGPEDLLFQEKEAPADTRGEENGGRGLGRISQLRKQQRGGNFASAAGPAPRPLDSNKSYSGGGSSNSSPAEGSSPPTHTGVSLSAVNVAATTNAHLDAFFDDLLDGPTLQQEDSSSTPLGGGNTPQGEAAGAATTAIAPSPRGTEPGPIRPIYPPLTRGQWRKCWIGEELMLAPPFCSSEDLGSDRAELTPSGASSNYSRLQGTTEQVKGHSSPSQSPPISDLPAAEGGPIRFTLPSSLVTVRVPPTVPTPTGVAVGPTSRRRLMSFSDPPPSTSGSSSSPVSSPSARRSSPSGGFEHQQHAAESSALPQVSAPSLGVTDLTNGLLAPPLTFPAFGEETISPPSSTQVSSSSSHNKSFPDELVELITSPTVASIGAGLQFIKKHNYQHHHHPHHYHHHQGHHYTNRALHKQVPEKRTKKKGPVSIGWVHRENTADEEEERRRVPVRRARHKSTPLRLQHQLEGNHFSTSFLGIQYMQLYRNYMYTFDPLHPIVLDESQIRYYLCTAEGMEEKSIFTFSMNVMFCLGSMLSGDHKSSVEFRMRAEDLLNFLHQLPGTTNDYSFATGLTALAFNTLYWEMNNAKSADYLRMAINTCKRSQALNSDAYSRCLYALSFHPFTELADIQNLKKELEMAKKLPYVPLTTTNMPCSAQDVEKWQSLIPISLEDLNIVNAAFGVISNLISGLILYKANANRFTAKDNQSTLYHFLEAITALETEITLIQSKAPDTFPKPTSKFIKFYICSLRAECFWMLEDKQMALKWAERFLFESIKPDSKYSVAGVSQLIGIVLNIFLRTEKYDLLNMQLQGIEEWAKLVPIVRTIQFNYLKELELILRKSSKQIVNFGANQPAVPKDYTTTESGMMVPNKNETSPRMSSPALYSQQAHYQHPLHQQPQPQPHHQPQHQQQYHPQQPQRQPSWCYTSRENQQRTEIEMPNDRRWQGMQAASDPRRLPTATSNAKMAPMHPEGFCQQTSPLQHQKPTSKETVTVCGSEAERTNELLGQPLESADFDLYAEVAREMGSSDMEMIPGEWTASNNSQGGP